MIALQRAAAARPILDRLARNASGAERLPDDPVDVVRRYPRPEDQELVGLLAASLAYGRVTSILGALDRILAPWGRDPARAVRSGAHLDPLWAPGFRYRWTTRTDLVALFAAVRNVTREEGSLGEALASRVDGTGDFERGLGAWVSDLRAGASEISPLSRGLRFLLADPAGSSACKRLRLYLRWMVRPDDGTDLGTWSDRLDPSALVLPLDTHWARMGPRLGLARRRIPDGKMALELTSSLRRIRPEDPLVYDFPVCHLGIEGGCPPKLTTGHCRRCPLREMCPTRRRRLAASRLEAEAREA